jgi:hypothetical protein
MYVTRVLTPIDELGSELSVAIRIYIYVFVNFETYIHS